MDEFLPYFRAALEQPGTVPPWSQWWAQHRNRAEDILDPAGFELLRHVPSSLVFGKLPESNGFRIAEVFSDPLLSSRFARM